MTYLSGLSEHVQFQGFPWRSSPCSPAGSSGARWAGERCASRFPSSLDFQGCHNYYFGNLIRKYLIHSRAWRLPAKARSPSDQMRQLLSSRRTRDVRPENDKS